MFAANPATLLWSSGLASCSSVRSLRKATCTRHARYHLPEVSLQHSRAPFFGPCLLQQRKNQSLRQFQHRRFSCSCWTHDGQTKILHRDCSAFVYWATELTFLPPSCRHEFLQPGRIPEKRPCLFDVRLAEVGNAQHALLNQEEGCFHDDGNGGCHRGTNFSRNLTTAVLSLSP